MSQNFLGSMYMEDSWSNVRIYFNLQQALGYFDPHKLKISNPAYMNPKSHLSCKQLHSSILMGMFHFPFPVIHTSFLQVLRGVTGKEGGGAIAPPPPKILEE